MNFFPLTETNYWHQHEKFLRSGQLVPGSIKMGLKKLGGPSNQALEICTFFVGNC